MSWERRGEDGDGGEQTPGHGQPLFELPLQDPRLQMTFSIGWKERREPLFCSSWLMLLWPLMPRRCLIFISTKKGRQRDGEKGQWEDLLSAHLLHKWRGTRWQWTGFCIQPLRNSCYNAGNRKTTQKANREQQWHHCAFEWEYTLSSILKEIWFSSQQEFQHWIYSMLIWETMTVLKACAYKVSKSKMCWCVAVHNCCPHRLVLSGSTLRCHSKTICKAVLSH